MNQKQIGSAIDRNGKVIVYDTNGRILFIKIGQLVGYTADTVSIKSSRNVTTYDVNGHTKFIK